MYVQNNSSFGCFFILVLLMLIGFGLLLGNDIYAIPNMSLDQAMRRANEAWQSMEPIVVGATGISIAIGFILYIKLQISMFVTKKRAASSYARRDENAKRDDKRIKFPQKSIVAIMRIRRTKNLLIVLSVLLFVLLISILLSPFIGAAIEHSTQTVILACIILIALGHFSFEYRVTHRLFGNNEREAREIIEFLLREADNIDFTDGGKAKKILSEEEIREIRTFVTKPGEALS